MFLCTGIGKTAIKAQLTAHWSNWIITYPSIKGPQHYKRSLTGTKLWFVQANQTEGSWIWEASAAALLLTPRTCVWSSSDSKVPAWGNIDWLGVYIALSVPIAPLWLCPIVPMCWGGVELLQVHVVVDQDHLAHPRVIAGHMRLPDVGQDDGWVVQESHSVHKATPSLYYLLSILSHGHTYLGTMYTTF